MQGRPLRICAVTGSRGEYGALRWLIKDLSADPGVRFKLIVMGSHWLKDYGFTYREIEKDGFSIDARVVGDFDTRSAVSLAHAVGRWTAKLADALDKMKPELVIVAGDRYELLAVGAACLLLLIPMAHISGGETTEGAIDEQIRHAVTKMSHLHFASNDLSAGRIRQMGEEPWRICVSGDPGLDTLRRLKFLTKRELEALVGLDLSKPTALCTFHPVTLEADRNERHVKELLKALDRVSLQYVLTFPNADHGSHRVAALLKRFARNHPKTVRLVPSLGQHAYLSLMPAVKMMIGNSSSGLWEAPSFNLPAVNIGNRQKGRLRAKNIIDVECAAPSIIKGIRRGLSYPRRGICRNPYGDGRSSARIQKFIKRIFSKKDRESILKKRFVTQRGPGGAYGVECRMG